MQQEEVGRPAEHISALDRGDVLGRDPRRGHGFARVEPEQQRRQREQRHEGDDGTLDRAEEERAGAASIAADPRRARAEVASGLGFADRFPGWDLPGVQRVAAAIVAVGDLDIGVRSGLRKCGRGAEKQQ